MTLDEADLSLHLAYDKLCSQDISPFKFGCIVADIANRCEKADFDEVCRRWNRQMAENMRQNNQRIQEMN